ncbi:MAG: hypothetical protein HY544_04695 [Candidatus Diapherotrites archaeon]|uniref:AbrB/MazE/SpoVT family DNA-binding domain-containing protein n=1 Tax=Candidatus Iainarchaeum sp. TaxID=3101447 RepID=A0A8T3YNE0_9ARCH|nr:hypothetical protein [Candidatus Diapherotrites archaeon]
MAETEVIVKARKWGNSIGFTVPKNTVEKEGIRAGEDFRLRISRPLKMPHPGSFGFLNGWKIDSQKLKDRLREESDW